MDKGFNHRRELADQIIDDVSSDLGLNKSGIADFNGNHRERVTAFMASLACFVHSKIDRKGVLLYAKKALDTLQQHKVDFDAANKADKLACLTRAVKDMEEISKRLECFIQKHIDAGRIQGERQTSIIDPKGWVTCDLVPIEMADSREPLMIINAFLKKIGRYEEQFSRDTLSQFE